MNVCRVPLPCSPSRWARHRPSWTRLLEQGKVTVEDFVKFTKSLFEQYGENAKIIRDGPSQRRCPVGESSWRSAAKHWQAAGPDWCAAFQDTFTAIAKAINVAIEALNRFLGIGTENAWPKPTGKLKTLQAASTMSKATAGRS